MSRVVGNFVHSTSLYVYVPPLRVLYNSFSLVRLNVHDIIITIMCIPLFTVFLCVVLDCQLIETPILISPERDMSGTQKDIT